MTPHLLPPLLCLSLNIITTERESASPGWTVMELARCLYRNYAGDPDWRAWAQAFASPGIQMHLITIGNMNIFKSKNHLCRDIFMFSLCTGYDWLNLQWIAGKKGGLIIGMPLCENVSREIQESNHFF